RAFVEQGFHLAHVEGSHALVDQGDAAKVKLNPQVLATPYCLLALEIGLPTLLIGLFAFHVNLEVLEAQQPHDGDHQDKDGQHHSYHDSLMPAHELPDPLVRCRSSGPCLQQTLLAEDFLQTNQGTAEAFAGRGRVDVE